MPVTVCQPLLEWATLESQVFDERTPLAITAAFLGIGGTINFGPF